MSCMVYGDEDSDQRRKAVGPIEMGLDDTYGAGDRQRVGDGERHEDKPGGGATEETTERESDGGDNGERERRRRRPSQREARGTTERDRDEGARERRRDESLRTEERATAERVTENMSDDESG